MLKKFTTNLIILLICKGSFAFASSNIEKLKLAYPNHIKDIKENQIIFYDNSSMIYDDKIKKNFNQKLSNASLKDQMNIEYISIFKKENHIPKQNEDPGRIRNDEFFKKIYGSSKKEVRAKLKKVIWLKNSVKKQLWITSVNDVHKKLQNISDELEKLPFKYHKYFNKPAGTFKFRKIAKTNRLSTHSYAIAIDLNVNKSNYWLWSRNLKYKNQIPIEIVKIFEKYGFIWGGRWYHYDTMHFEYRPELLIN